VVNGYEIGWESILQLFMMQRELRSFPWRSVTLVLGKAALISRRAPNARRFGTNVCFDIFQICR
jgi:hypothetical protein